MARPLNLLLAAFAAVLAVALAPSAALAAPGFDLRGTWDESNGQHMDITITTLDCATGAFTGSQDNITVHWPVKGTLDGAHLTADEGPFTYTSAFLDYHYYPDLTFTDTDHATGTFSDVNGIKDRKMTWTRKSGPPATGGCTGLVFPGGLDPGTGGPTPTPTPLVAPGLHPTALQVSCTYVVATGLDTCTATVGDAAAQPTTPTGTVSFAASEGSLLGASCALASSPTSPSTASCAVPYQRPFGSTKFPEVSGSYAGDATHAPSTGATTFLILGGPPTFETQTPNQLHFMTPVDADGTSVTACATVSAKGAGASRAAAVRLDDDPGTEPVPSLPQADADLEKILKQVEKAGGAPGEAMLPTIQATLEKAQRAMRQNRQSYDEEMAKDKKRAEQIKADLDRLEKDVDTLSTMLVASCKPGPTATRAVLLASASAYAPRPKQAKVLILGSFKAKTAKAGPLAITLNLKKSGLKKVRKGKKPVTVSVRIVTRTPNGLVKKGWPSVAVAKVSIGADGRLVP